MAKKIMFSDRYGLTEAVLIGRKTMTRRAVSEKLWDRWTDYDDWCNTVAVSGVPKTRQYYEEKDFFLDNSTYKVGEVVAVAQSYKEACVNFLPEEDEEFGCYSFPAEQTPGWTNKMFVRAALMPRHIRITDVKVERLQDISDDDCLREGVVKCVHKLPSYNTDPSQYLIDYYPCQHLIDCEKKVGWGRVYSTPQAAFAELIDFVSGKGTWDSNPWVFAYEFELVD